MPSSLVATVGSASANTYATLAEASTYFGDRLNSETWTAANADKRTIALLMAAKRMERENWIGGRVTSTQALAWPRAGAEKPDSVPGIAGDDIPGAGIVSWYRGNYGTYTAGVDYYDTDVIPTEIKNAQCELALAYLEGFNEDQDGANIDEFNADGISVKFGSGTKSNALPLAVRRLIGPLVRGTVLRRG